ncbi:MAG: formylglycine-generating enzyme family protein [Candidatus Hodarchaeota archaeon]
MNYCDSEKSLLQDLHNINLEIIFDPTDGNQARSKNLVRNGIPVEIKVMLYSKEFGVQDVTNRVKWEYLNKNLGKVILYNSDSTYVYLHDSTNSGSQKIIANLENYKSPPLEFEVSPVALVEVAGGDTFSMGNDTAGADLDEMPVHPVYINTFLIGQFEVTNIEYKVFLDSAKELVYKSESPGREGFYSGNNLCLGTANSKIKYNNNEIYIDAPPDSNYDDLPVTGVTWIGANLFAEYYSFKLPTEAQWEYACKGKTNEIYPDGNIENLENYAVFGTNTPKKVGTKRANIWKIYDIYGNVWEWCNDLYSESYYKKQPYPHVNPSGPPEGSGIERVIRGGSYRSEAYECRSTNRDYRIQHNTYNNLGFRIVLTY